MSATATWGQGGKLKLGATTVTQLTNIVPPGFDSDDIDVSTHDSLDGFREYIKGMTDAGEVELEGNFLYTNYAHCYELMMTRTLQSVTILLPTLPTNTKFECNGYVKSLSCEDPVDDKIPFSCTVKVSGKPSLSLV